MLTDNLDTYMNHKYIEYFIYNFNLDEDTYKDNYDRVEVLEIISSYVDLNRNLIDDVVANHIRSVVNKFRDIIDNDTIKRNDAINEIIINLNKDYDKDINYAYYRTQLYTRTKDKKFFTDSKEAIDVDKSEINISIAFDFSLLSFLIDVPEEMFKEHLSELQDNEFVYLSLRAILCEFPNALKNETFINRLNEVLNIKTNNKEHKKLVKEIKKLKRKF